MWTTLSRLAPRGGKRTIGGLGLKVLGNAVVFELEAVSLKKGLLWGALKQICLRLKRVFGMKNILVNSPYIGFGK